MVRWQPIPRWFRRARWRAFLRRTGVAIAANELRGALMAAPGFAALLGWR
jgi:hypothetical protein